MGHNERCPRSIRPASSQIRKTRIARMLEGMNSKFSVLFPFVMILLITGLTFAQGTRYAVQLGATQVQEEATAKILELRTKDVQAYIVKTNVPGKGTFYRIRVGMFADINAAKK